MSLKKKVVWLPYDFDTGIGINNEGSLVFDYRLEDIDHLTGGADVFNGQESVIWKNIRAAFAKELAEMYKTLRSTGALSYAKVEQMFEEHQGKWPEAIFNEDAWFKYIDPLVESGTGDYLGMMQGSKAEQRKWWLYNRFRYIDSKYNAGDALSDLIQVRGYAKANITVTPYADIYPSVKYGSYLVQERGTRGTPTTLVCPLDNVNDTEIYIYSSSQLASVGDLSGLKVGFADFSMATRLQSVKIGDSSSSYENQNLSSLTLGNNVLLKVLDVRNCSGLGDTSITGHTQTAVDISHCEIIEEVYFDGTKIQGLTLPDGGVLKKLHLPATMTNLTILNQVNITEFVIPSYANITTLRLENTPTLDTKTILNSISANTRVRLLGFYWEAEDAEEIEDLLDLLDTMRGLDESGNNMETAQVSGTIHTSSLTGAEIASYNARYPYLSVVADHVSSVLTYMTWDGGTTLKTVTCLDGVPQDTAPSSPSRTATAQYTYTFVGWNTSTDAQVNDASCTTNVVADRTVYAAYSRTVRTYTVRFYNGSTLLQTVNSVAYGGSATYTGTTPVSPDGSAEDYPFEGWNPAPTNIQGDTSCYAVFGSPLEVAEITDTWAQIIAACANGTYASKYKVGNYKPLDLGTEGTVNMQIVGKDADSLASGSGTAPLTWLSMELLATSKRMNPSLVTNYKFESGPSFARKSSTLTNTGYNEWDAKNAYTANNTAKITLTVTAVATGTLRLKYITGGSSGNSTTLTVDGTNVISSHSTSAQNYDLSITNGTTYVIEFINTKLTSTDATTAYVKLCNTSDSGKNADVSTLVTQDSVVIENCSVRVIDYYSSGTGTIGGFEACEMRAYLKNTVKPLIPETVRNAIRPVTKYSRIYDTSGSAVNNVGSTEDVWIPSMLEVNFTGCETDGPRYKAAFPDNASRIKKKAGASSASWWWLRSANNNNNFYNVNTSGSNNNNNANNTGGVAVGFCT